ncbi:hypothetical protein CDD81_6216 [Ophiocordyceps australis]|uniref:Uncharacterized protein n=1 Tax=Ophiocordyceps australis TaxID=1399860 RepID=A0A2C5Y0Z4_9HYPO|nr:hypothetical protein CDD81_6216 [Ophiocordyceps australis]
MHSRPKEIPSPVLTAAQLVHQGFPTPAHAHPLSTAAPSQTNHLMPAPENPAKIAAPRRGTLPTMRMLFGTRALPQCAPGASAGVLPLGHLLGIGGNLHVPRAGSGRFMEQVVDEMLQSHAKKITAKKPKT